MTLISDSLTMYEGREIEKSETIPVLTLCGKGVNVFGVF